MVCRLLLPSLVFLALPRTGFGQPPAAEPPGLQSTPAPQAAAPISKSYFVPFFDIVAFDFLLNRFNYRFIDRGTYDVDISSIRRNVRSPWVLDSDPFSINQFMHPYQGSMYHGFARSAGLNYWESLAYTFGGSMLWEIAGETRLPSRNDQIATGIGGTFLGEPLFRLASRVLERSDHLPRFWRVLAAMVISPSTGFNRLVFQFTSSTGSRFENIFSRGLLAGKAYVDGADRYRGIWGLYGTYDYVSPQVFRVSSTAFALGTTVQRRLFESAALQSALLAAAGYGAGGGIGGRRQQRLSLRPDAPDACRRAFHTERQDSVRSDVP